MAHNHLIMFSRTLKDKLIALLALRTPTILHFPVFSPFSCRMPGFDGSKRTMRSMLTFKQPQSSRADTKQSNNFTSWDIIPISGPMKLFKRILRNHLP